MESGIACTEFVPNRLPNNITLRRFLIPELNCSLPTYNPFLTCEVNLRLEKWCDECSLNSIICVTYTPSDVQKVLAVASSCASGLDADKVALAALKSRLTTERDAPSERKYSVQLLPPALEKNARPLFELLKDAEGFTTDGLKLLVFAQDSYIQRLNDFELRLFNNTIVKRPELCCFWYDFALAADNGLFGTRTEKFRAPLEVVWNLSSRLFGSRIVFMNPSNACIPLPRISARFPMQRYLQMANAVRSDVEAGRIAIAFGDLEYDLLPRDESMFRMLTWLHVNENISPTANKTWERYDLMQMNTAICNLLEGYVLVNNVYEAEVNVRSLLFIRHDSNCDLDALATNYASEGFYVFTAAQSATRHILFSSLDLLSIHNAFQVSILVILVAQKLSSVELYAILQKVTGLLILVGDPYEHGPTIFRADGRGGGDPFRHLMEHYMPNCCGPSPSVGRLIISEVDKAISSGLVIVSNSPDDNKIVRAHVKRLQKICGTRTKITCAGDSIDDLIELLNDGRPKFTRPLHLSDRNIDADVVQVADRFPVHDSSKLLLREHPSRIMLYDIQFVARGAYEGPVRKVYRQASKMIESGDKLTKAVLNQHGDDITNEVVMNALVDGGCIESCEVFNHARVTPLRTNVMIHVASPGSSLEDICSSMKYADKLYVVLAAGASVFNVNDLPLRRHVARNGLSKLLSNLRA